MNFSTDGAEAVDKALRNDYQDQTVSVIIEVYHNDRILSAGMITIALREPLESIKASIIKQVSQKHPNEPRHVRLRVLWRHDPPKDIMVTRVSEGRLPRDYTDVDQYNVGLMLCLVKERSSVNMLVASLEDAPREEQVTAGLTHKQGTGKITRETGKKRKSRRRLQSNHEDKTQAFNTTAFTGGMFAAQRKHKSGSCKVRSEPVRENSPRRMQGPDGWEEENSTHQRDPHDRGTTMGALMSGRKMPEPSKSEGRSENARTEDPSHLRNTETML